MKLDSAPLKLSDISQSESESELKDCSETIDLPKPVLANSPQKQDKAVAKTSSLAIFGSTFLTIFLAELGDKTQLSTLLMSAESQAPWVVFMGSAAALITTSLLGVLLGSWIANRLSPKTVEKSAGVMLLLISVMLVWDLVQN